MPDARAAFQRRRPLHAHPVGNRAHSPPRPAGRARVSGAGTGGYIWAYLGDPVRFPPPPLETQVPEELLKPDEFICFRLPTSTWKANWLLAIDGSDGFHAVVLHTDSQAVHRAERKPGSNEIPLEDRRIKIIRTSHGVRGVSVDLEGEPINHGHFTVDVRASASACPV